MKETRKVDDIFSVGYDENTEKYCVLKKGKPIVNGTVGFFDKEESVINNLIINRRLFEHIEPGILER